MIHRAIEANTAPQTEPCPLCGRLDPHSHLAAEWRHWEDAGRPTYEQYPGIPRDKIRRVPSTEHEPCGAPSGPACTLPKGHTGWHLAADIDGNELAYWAPERCPLCGRKPGQTVGCTRCEAIRAHDPTERQQP